MNFQKVRKSRTARLIIILIILILAGALWYYAKQKDNKWAQGAAIVAGGAALIAGGAELSGYDLDLGELAKTGSLKQAILKRDENGNLVNIQAICDAQAEGFYDYDCADFKTQQEAQRVYEQCGTDVNRLDGDKDGIVCEHLPKK